MPPLVREIALATGADARCTPPRRFRHATDAFLSRTFSAGTARCAGEATVFRAKNLRGTWMISAATRLSGGEILTVSREAASLGRRWWGGCG
jgi:hypothetical protein